MKKIALFIIIISFFPLNVFSSPQSNQNNKQFFAVEKAYQQLDEINKELTVPGINLEVLVNKVRQLEDSQAQAKICIDKSNAQLKALNELLEETNLEYSLLIQQDEYKYLQDKKIFYAKHLSDCRLYVYLSDEALVDYKDTIQKISAYKILQHSTPIWEIQRKEIWHSLVKFDYQRIYKASGLDSVSLSQFIFGFILVSLGLAIAIYFRTLLRNWNTKQTTQYPPVYSLTAVLAEFIVPLTFFGVLSVVVSAILAKVQTNTTIEIASYSILLFVLLCALSKYLFSPPDGANNLLWLPSRLGKSFHKRIISLLLWIIAGCMTILFLGNQPFSVALIDLVQTLYVTILLVLIVWAIWPCCKIPAIQKVNQKAVLFIKAVLCTTLFIMIMIEWLGFHQLAVFLITALLLTLGLLSITAGAWRLIDILYQLVDNSKYYTARKIKQLLGVKPHKKLNEILLVKFIAYTVLTGFFTIFLMKVWGISANVLDSIIDGLSAGFTVAELKIVPLRIIYALILFSLVLLVGRFIATIIAKKEQFENEKDTQVAVASIIIYITFVIALLMFLLVVGVNFTGLAIIAGALSVGIGLGLQNIANNFISGIILLLEKPIKPGDRVIVGSTEGFVKKVRLRSTQITTLAKEDVIVPNADLIANQVTNYMFRNKYWRVVCQVGVAYGSPVALVKELLLDAASKHPDVIQEAPNQPVVLFKEFGDSSLIFELWCIIRNVNKKYIVTSDLNFQIDSTFREHKVTIAFPQRDIHVKEHVNIDRS